MFCSNCGSQLGENDRFCGNCGQPVEPSLIPGAGAEDAAAVMPQAPEAQVPETPAAEPAVQTPEVQEPAAEPTVQEPAAEPTAEPTVQEPVAEPAAEPAVQEPVAEPAAEPIAEPADNMPEAPNPEKPVETEQLGQNIMKNMENDLIFTMPLQGAPGQEAPQGVPVQGAAGRPGPEAGMPPYGAQGQGMPGRGPAGPQPGAARPYPGVPQGMPGGGKEPSGYGAQPQPPKKKKSRVPIMIAIVIAVLAIGGGITAWLLLSSPSHKLKNSLKDHDYVTAEQIYDETFTDQNRDKADAILEAEMQSIWDEYSAGKMDYTTARRYMSAIDQFWNTSSSHNFLNQLESLGSSHSAFEKAENAMKQENYETAIQNYKLVIEADENYQKAQEQLKTAQDKYSEQIITKANELAAAKNYDDAIDLLNQGLNVLPDHEPFRTLLSDMEAKNEQAAIDDILNQAKGYADTGEYFSAMFIIQDALISHPNQKDLTDALTGYKDGYRTAVLDKAEKALGSSNDYETAITILDSALDELNGNYPEIEQPLQDKREEYVQKQLESGSADLSQMSGRWDCTRVSMEGFEMGIDDFLTYAGMSDTEMYLELKADGSLYVNLLGETANGTWEQIGSDSTKYNLIIDGDGQEVTINEQGAMLMDLDGTVLIYEKTGA